MAHSHERMKSENQTNENRFAENYYYHLYVVVEHLDGKLIPVSLEMLGEARRIMDNFNSRYNSNEKVVAVVLGNNIDRKSVV